MRFSVLCLAIALLGFGDGPSRNDFFQQSYRSAVRAYEQKDFPAMIRHLTAADSARPNTHSVVYNLAAAYALNGQADEAFHYLRLSLWLNADTGYVQDDDFQSLRSDGQLKNILEQSRFFLTRECHATEAFRLPDATFHPEGITFDAISGAFFTGSIRSGRIARIHKGNADLEWSRVPYSAMGMRVDAKRRTLWVGSTAMPELATFNDSLKGRAAVVAIDLDSGRIRQTFSVEGSHVFGDLCVLKNGDVYVSDSEEPNIYRIHEGRMELWSRVENAWNLQGIDVTADERCIYVADYITGIYRVDLATKMTQRILCEPMTALRGIDGLVVRGSGFVAIQNGARPFRVTRLTLDQTGLRIGKVEFIARAADELNEPTLGTIVGDDFYFIANSPWGAYDKNGRFDTAKSSPPLILKASAR